jgi:hypothetical protein
LTFVQETNSSHIHGLSISKRRLTHTHSDTHTHTLIPVQCQNKFRATGGGTISSYGTQNGVWDVHTHTHTHTQTHTTRAGEKRLPHCRAQLPGVRSYPPPPPDKGGGGETRSTWLEPERGRQHHQKSPRTVLQSRREEGKATRDTREHSSQGSSPGRHQR